MYMQLEDEFGDVVGKARRGQELSTAELGASCGLSEQDVEAVEQYRLIPDADVIDGIAEFLGLHAGKLQASAGRGYFPRNPAGRPTEGVVVEMMVLGTDFLMNGYVVGCAETRQGAVIDPGFEAEKILDAVGTFGLEIGSVLLTHGHDDHTGALSEVCQATGATALIHEGDLALLGSLRNKIDGYLSDGQTLSVGNLQFHVARTSGHTPGGVSIIHEQFAFVGDALFAGSLGGTRRRSNYQAQRKAVLEHIIGLDERVILYPGHGPATTVAEERVGNPFFD